MNRSLLCLGWRKFTGVNKLKFRTLRKEIVIHDIFISWPMGVIGNKKKIKLEQEDGVTEGEEALKAYIASYYRVLFGPHNESQVSLDETQVDEIP